MVGLFTGVRGRGILRSSPLQSSKKLALSYSTHSQTMVTGQWACRTTDAPGTPELLKALVGSLQTEGPRLEVPRRPATVIAPPLSGKGW
jgi:hypothetical protein